MIVYDSNGNLKEFSSITSINSFKPCDIYTNKRESLYSEFDQMKFLEKIETIENVNEIIIIKMK